MTQPAAAERYAAGLKLFQSGHHAAAERALRDAISLDPNHDHAHALRGLSLLNLGRAEEALEAANIALGIRPGLDALRARVAALIDLRRPHEAVSAARDALALAPANGLAAYALARALESAKMAVEAGQMFKRAADMAPTDMMLRAEYGRFLIRRRQIAPAEAIAAEIGQEVDIDSVVLLRGEVALWRGRLDEARELALWVLSRNAVSRQAVILLTLATANRRPLLAAWWRYTYIIRAGSIWHRIILLTLILVSSLAFAGIPFLLLIYLSLAKAQVNRLVQDELKAVRLRKGF